MNASDWVPVLLGAGGAGFILAVVQAWNSLRDSAEVREGRAMANLERWAQQCQDDLAYERLLGTYWLRTAAQYERALRLGGLAVPDTGTPPPPRPRNVTPEGRSTTRQHRG